jgi:hypothetical protein
MNFAEQAVQKQAGALAQMGRHSTYPSGTDRSPWADVSIVAAGLCAGRARIPDELWQPGG